MSHYPKFNSPKEVNLEYFLAPSQIIEVGGAGLIVQENKIYPANPIFIDYSFYNWSWTSNEDTETPDKWHWMDVNGQLIEDSAGTTPGTGIEGYAPIRIWMKGSTEVTIDVAKTAGTRDESRYNGARLRDLTYYMRKGAIDLGRVTSERTPRNTEFYIKDNIIFTNYDFDNDPDSISNLIIVYETITKNVKLQIDQRTNEKNKAFYTPVVEDYQLKASGQTSTMEQL